MILRVNQNIYITHGPQLRLRVQRLQIAPLHRQIRYTISLKSGENSVERLHLPLVSQKHLVGNEQHFLHHRMVLGDAAMNRALINQRHDRLLADNLTRFLQ